MDIKTNPDLLAALRTAATSRTLSAHEVTQQRVSFVMGMINDKNGSTREDVIRVINKQNGLSCA